jgi:hypothetical protein
MEKNALENIQTRLQSIEKELVALYCIDVTDLAMLQRIESKVQLLQQERTDLLEKWTHIQMDGRENFGLST